MFLGCRSCGESRCSFKCLFCRLFSKLQKSCNLTQRYYLISIAWLQPCMTVVPSGSTDLKGYIWLSLSLFLCLCSVLSKETGITVVAVCLTYDLFIFNKVITEHFYYCRSSCLSWKNQDLFDGVKWLCKKAYVHMPYISKNARTVVCPVIVAQW